MSISKAGFESVWRYSDMFRDGMLCTIYLSFFTVILGFVLALGWLGLVLLKRGVGMRS